MEDSSNLMSKMEEEDFLMKLSDIEKCDQQETELKKTKYNPRDPAAAQASSFAAAFSTLKNSKFYSEPEPVKPSTNGVGAPSSSKDGATSVAGASDVVLAPSAHRLARTGALLVSPRQRGNPLLKAIGSVPWEFDDTIVPDYVMGLTTCALFLSLRYHNLNPDYIHDRLKLLGSKFVLRVLLVQVDLADPAHVIKHLNRLCILADLTLMLAGSPEEAGRILETYKMFENKPPEMIMERKEEGIHTKVQNALTTVRSVNKTDASTLVKNFGSLENILKANASELELCAGFGAQKAQRLEAVLHQPFLRRP